MPAALHRALEAQARKNKLTGKRKDAYVYGTLRKAMKAKERIHGQPERGPRQSTSRKQPNAAPRG
ncbi:MAG: hypothetical protein ACYSUI_13520 [Planctomycetota bacterium]|jgi:hypothetical protein